eukprot:gene7148-11461_t
MNSAQTTTKKIKSNHTKTKNIKSKKKDDTDEQHQQILLENNILKESLVTKELEIKKKEEELKDLEFEHQMYIEELTKENEIKIKELSAKLALVEHQKDIYFQNLQKMGVNPLNLKQIDLNEDESYQQQKVQIQKKREHLISSIQNKSLKFGNQIQILDNIKSQFTMKNKENFF